MWNLVHDWKKKEDEEEEEKIKALISQWQLQMVGRLRREVKGEECPSFTVHSFAELSKFLVNYFDKLTISVNLVITSLIIDFRAF